MASAHRFHMLDVSTDRLTRTVDLLTETNRILAASFDVSDTLPALANACVPAFAEYCLVQTEADEGIISQAVYAAPENVDIGPSAGLEINDGLAVHLGARGLQSCLVVPMAIAAQTFGSVCFARQDPDAFDELDRKLANLLALRMAIAVHTVGSFSREHRVANRLRDALLPQSFPAVTGLTFGSDYKPASSEAQVGGDWYDAFALPDGRIAVSIGDVAGHGLDAAIIMGEVRQALRAAAILADKPSAILEAVNGVINLRDVGMVTAIFAFYDPENAILRYAVAGHPPPIIATTDGFAHILPGGGLPLGASSAVQARDWTFAIPPGGQVVLYTDGLIENDRDIERGQENLLEVIASELERNGAADPAKAIQRRIFAAASNKDDAATLTLTRDTKMPTDVTLTFSAIPIVSGLVRSTLRQLAKRLEMNDDETFALLVAVGEAIANAVEHAYGDREPGLVDVKTHYADDRFTVQIDDYGRWRPFQKREERGRGIPLMHALVDGVQIKSSQTNTCITLSLDLKRTKEASA